MAMVGLAARKHVETDGLMQRSGQERSAVGFAMHETGTSRDGRTGTEQEMNRSSEADEGWIWWASLHGNTQKRAYASSEADERTW